MSAAKRERPKRRAKKAQETQRTVNSESPDADGSAGILASSEEARHRWPEFVEAFEKCLTPSKQHFGVLVLCGDEYSPVEALWLKVTTIEGGVVRGINVPRQASFEANESDILDWLHIDNSGKATGCFTDAVVRKHFVFD